jgi:hypothetical protein
MWKRKCRYKGFYCHFFFFYIFFSVCQPVQQRIYGVSIMIIMSRHKGRFCKIKIKTPHRKIDDSTTSRSNTVTLVFPACFIFIEQTINRKAVGITDSQTKHLHAAFGFSRLVSAEIVVKYYNHRPVHYRLLYSIFLNFIWTVNVIVYREHKNARCIGIQFETLTRLHQWYKYKLVSAKR